MQQIIWRPRPKIELPTQVEDKIEKDFKNLTKKYDDEDDEIINKELHEKQKKRKELKDKFTKYMEKKRKQWETTRAARQQLLGFDEDNLSDLTYDEIVESEDLLETRK